MVAGTIGPWIPTLKADNRLDAGELGLALAGFAVGLVLGTRCAGPAMRRLDGRAVIRIGIPCLAGALAMLPIAGGLVTFALLLSIVGFASGLLDVVMNAEAVAVERALGRRVMSSLHGTWSVAVLFGAGTASLAIAIGTSLEIALPSVAVVLVIASFPVLRWLPEDAPVRANGTVARTPVGAVPRLRVLALCAVAAASFLSEGVAIEWSALLLRDGLGARAAIAGLGVVAFSAGMAVSRFLGDRAADRLGERALVRVGAATGAVALGASLIVGDATVAIGAFAVLGLGLGAVVPSAFRAAGGLRLGPDRTALAIVVTAGYVGSIVGPLVVGLTADRYGLRVAFAIPVVASLLASAAAGATEEVPAGSVG